MERSIICIMLQFHYYAKITVSFIIGKFVMDVDWNLIGYSEADFNHSVYCRGYLCYSIL